MSDSFAPPGESASDLWLERSVFAGTMLGSVAFGIHLCVYAVAVYHLALHPPGKRPLWAPLAPLTLLFALGVFQVAGNTKFFEEMFIDDRGIDGGPIAWLTMHFDDPVNTFASVAYIVANFMMDGMLLYRLLVIYDYNYPVVVVPTLAFIASTILSVFTVFQSAQPGLGLWSHTTFQFALPYFSLSIALNATMTLAIVLRLLYMRRRLAAAFSSDGGGHAHAHAQMYTSAAALFVESGAAYTVVGLIFIISYARGSNVQNLCLQTLDQVVCISPELIILRIARGRAWSKDTTAHMSLHPLLKSHHGRGGDRSANTDLNDTDAGADGGIALGALHKPRSPSRGSRGSTKTSAASVDSKGGRGGDGDVDAAEELRMRGVEELRRDDIV